MKWGFFSLFLLSYSFWTPLQTNPKTGIDDAAENEQCMSQTEYKSGWNTGSIVKGGVAPEQWKHSHAASGLAVCNAYGAGGEQHSSWAEPKNPCLLQSACSKLSQKTGGGLGRNMMNLK